MEVLFFIIYSVVGVYGAVVVAVALSYITPFLDIVIKFCLSPVPMIVVLLRRAYLSVKPELPKWDGYTYAKYLFLGAMLQAMIISTIIALITGSLNEIAALFAITMAYSVFLTAAIIVNSYEENNALDETKPLKLMQVW